MIYAYIWIQIQNLGPQICSEFLFAIIVIKSRIREEEKGRHKTPKT